MSPLAPLAIVVALGVFCYAMISLALWRARRASKKPFSAVNDL